MMKPDDDEVVSLVLALEEVASTTDMKGGGLRFMCKEAARLIRRLRPDLAFKEDC